jgi:membrane associated rhomboid family serine protease
MPLLDSLEKVLGRFAIPGLMRYVVGLNALVYLLLLGSPGYAAILDLNREAILSGEVWRLITWIFLPTTTSPLWIFFYLMFTWWVGDSLEGMWGTFRLNAYYFLGVIACTAAALLFGVSGGNFLLTLSLLLAVATLAPDQEVLLLVFPVRLKWVALLSLVYPWGLLFVVGPMGTKAMIVVCLANYLLFFGPAFLAQQKGAHAAAERRSQFQKAAVTETTLHLCHACGATEISHPEADFRVAPDGHEYCARCLPRG